MFRGVTKGDADGKMSVVSHVFIPSLLIILSSSFFFAFFSSLFKPPILPFFFFLFLHFRHRFPFLSSSSALPSIVYLLLFLHLFFLILIFSLILSCSFSPPIFSFTCSPFLSFPSFCSSILLLSPIFYSSSFPSLS
jgi:hypothetical protein